MTVWIVSTVEFCNLNFSCRSAHISLHLFAVSHFFSVSLSFFTLFVVVSSHWVYSPLVCGCEEGWSACAACYWSMDLSVWAGCCLGLACWDYSVLRNFWRWFCCIHLSSWDTYKRWMVPRRMRWGTIMRNPMLFPHLVRPFLLMGALRSGMLPSVAVYVRRACVFLPCFILYVRVSCWSNHYWLEH